MKKMLLFTYGTLKKGRGNHGYLTSSRYLGQAFTDKGYTLCISGLPYMVKRRGGKGVKGELYEVDGVTMRMIDHLEGHPDFYERQMVRVTLFESGETLECWAYLHPDIFGEEECTEF